MTPRTARAILLATVVFASAGAGFWLHAFLAPRPVPAPAAPAAPMVTADALQAAFVSVAERVRPAVVQIGTVQVARPRRAPKPPGPQTDDPFLRDFFDQFFGPRGPGQRGEFHQPGVGSGVIVDRRGYVLTNFHVIKGSDEVLVRTSARREYRGRIVGTDPKTDLAVVRFEPDTELTVATMGNSDALRVGEWAIAIGNPFGLDQTVTIGVVSATGRADVGIASYENFVQTDASINPGNSGGPLVNLKSEVIGINTAIVATGQGIGFAIPANMARRITEQLIAGGRVTRGWLGVSLQPITAELAEALGLRSTRGAVVARVQPGSPAEAAGLKPNDVIVSFEGVPVDDYHHLQRLAAEASVGKAVKLDIVRDKQPRTVQLTVAEAPEGPGR